MDNNAKTFDLINFSPERKTYLIEASAGTGKTYSITGLFLKTLLHTEWKVFVEQILVVTFTNAATAELRERIFNVVSEAYEAFSNPDEYLKSDGCNDIVKHELEKALEEEKSKKDGSLLKKKAFLNYAVQNFDDASIFTIHGFCQRVLKKNAFESSVLFSSELVQDEDNIVEEIIEDFIRRNFYEREEDILEILFSVNSNIAQWKLSLKKIANEKQQKPLAKIKQQYEKIDILKLKKSVEKSFLEMKKAFNYEEIIKYFADNEIKKYGYRKDYLEKSLNKMRNAFLENDISCAGENDYQKFSYEKIQEKYKDKKIPALDFIDKNEAFLNSLDKLNNAKKQFVINLKLDFIKFYEAEMVVRKKRRQVRSFNDLLVEIHDALNEDEKGTLARAIRSNYKCAMIDEFQDTDELQFNIFTKIFDDSGFPLFFIGDPKQAIYSFRGADVFAYLESKKSAEVEYNLSSNYRSHQKVIDAVNYMFDIKRRPNPFMVEEISYVENTAGRSDISLLEHGEDSSGMRIIHLDTQLSDSGTYNKNQYSSEALTSTVEEIKLLIRKGNSDFLKIKEKDKSKSVKPGNICVLVRTNPQADEVVQLLKADGINAVKKSRLSIFETDEAHEMLYFMQAVAESSGKRYLFPLLTTSLFNENVNYIKNLENDEGEYNQLLSDFKNYHNLWRDKGFAKMFRTFFREKKIKQTLSSQSDSLRKITNFNHLAEIINRYELDTGAGMNALISFYISKLHDESGSDDYIIRLDSDDDAVQVATVHASKGLEYDILFCPYLWDFSQPVSRKAETAAYHDSGKMVLSLDKEDFKDNKNLIVESLSESLRLIYVAMTRARFRIYTYCADYKISNGNIKKSPLDYLICADYFDNVDKLIDYSNPKKGEDNDFDYDYFLKKFIDQSDDNIVLVEREISFSEENPPYERVDFVTNRSLEKLVENDWRITSYTYLASKGQENRPHRIEKEVDVSNESIEDEMLQNLSGFPGGAKAGSCLHEIFENIDFISEDFSEEIKSALSKYGFNFENDIESENEISLIQSVESMLDNVLNQKLNTHFGEFSLKTISGLKIPEAEFYFPIEKISASLLGKHIEQYYTEFDEARNLSFEKMSGFLKGYIDLIFEHEGRYYILDWKSNFIGEMREDYKREALVKSMNEHLYFLQYMIYTAASHLYLKTRIPDYSYEEHFGGVLYVYLRGADKNSKDMNGFYYDRPEEEFVKEFISIVS